MTLDRPVPKPVVRLANAAHEAGGRAWLVGGCVRDALLGRALKDWDVEVHGIEQDALERLLGTLGSVDAVGRQFAVYKLTRGGLTLDVSLPRTDSNAGPGHRGIAVTGNPHLGIREAARRRDLTINAILWDPRTGELSDPFGGLHDLQQRILRAVDPEHFLEDPLRALRVVQFAARLDFSVDDDLLQLCRDAATDELPAERIRDEWFKLLASPTPSVGMAVATTTGLLERVFPGVSDRSAELDRAVAFRDRLPEPGRRYALMLSVWLADIHPEPTLERLGLVRWRGYPLRRAVLAAVGAQDAEVATDRDLRWLATRAECGIVLGMQHAAGNPDAHARYDRAVEMGVHQAQEPPLVGGKDLAAMGVSPGPGMGLMLKRLYAAQIDGEVRTPDAANALAHRWVEQRARDD